MTGQYRERPMVSVGLPVFNGETHLARVLDSLAGDGYGNLEIIISDNASTDGTERICREHARRDARIRYERNERNLGSASNFEKALSAARGKYFLWASHHDSRKPDFISRCVALMEEDESVALCCSHAVWMADGANEAGLVPRPFDTRGKGQAGRFLAAIWRVGYCYQVYGVFRRDVLMKCLRLSPGLGPDHVLVAEAALLGSLACIPEPLFHVWRDADARSIHAYFRRQNLVLTPRTAARAIAEMIAAHFKVVNAHVTKPGARLLLFAVLLVLLPVRYARLFGGVLVSSFQNQRPPRTSGVVAD